MKEFIKNETILDSQIKDFCERYHGKSYDYSWLKTVEETLNNDLVNVTFIPSVVPCNLNENGEYVINSSLVEGNKFVQSAAGSGFGETAENWVYTSLVNNGFVEAPKNPNGIMKFPDYIAVNGTHMDAKSVICRKLIRKEGYSKNYNSGLGDIADIRNICKKFVETNRLDDFSSALIIIIYYIEEDCGHRVLKIKLVPELFYINVYSDLHDFLTKRADKNQNVQGSLVVRIDEENPSSCEPYLDRIRQTVNNLQ